MLLLSLALSITFTLFTQPLPMGMLLILQTLMTGFLCYKMTKFSWYTFILIITMAGALLVTFIYMSVLTPSEPSARRSFWALPIIIPPTLFLLLKPPLFLSNPLFNNMPSPLFLKSSLPLTMFLTLLLLMCLLIVVANTTNLKGPMRSY